MSVTKLSAPERETIVNFSDESNAVHIWTAQRTVLTALRKKPDHFTEVQGGFHGSTEWASFSTSLDLWNLATGAKRKGSPRPGASSSLPWSRTMVTNSGEGE